MGEDSSFPILLRGTPCFLVFGVCGEPETAVISFEPLAVFFSTQITLSYCGDDEAGQGCFPRIVMVGE